MNVVFLPLALQPQLLPRKIATALTGSPLKSRIRTSRLGLRVGKAYAKKVALWISDDRVACQ
jgi:hypothetical protein